MAVFASLNQEIQMNPKTCLFPNCKSIGCIRGLCHSHYTQASRYIRLKRTSWDQLEKDGKALPKNKVNSHLITPPSA